MSLIRVLKSIRFLAAECGGSCTADMVRGDTGIDLDEIERFVKVAKRRGFLYIRHGEIVPSCDLDFAISSGVERPEKKMIAWKDEAETGMDSAGKQSTMENNVLPKTQEPEVEEIDIEDAIDRLREIRKMCDRTGVDPFEAADRISRRKNG